jgi:dihydroorotate dehydrogenase
MCLLGACSKTAIPEWQPLDWRGLHFPNRLGIAGGVDKDGIGLKGWWTAGAGFLEIGTITPEPQRGNSGQLVARDPAHLALWNRLGFPSQGAARVASRLKKLERPFRTPIFANIGKNAITPLDSAYLDYLKVANQLDGLVDGFVVNISSPNTKGLRELLKPARLKEFLAPLKDRFAGVNWLLKLSPDIGDKELAAILETSTEAGVSGWILTNTSQGLRERLPFPLDGGVSGTPLANRSRMFLRSAIKILGPDKRDRLLVSVGGVMTPDDVLERLSLGADLVEVYAALIYSGPLFFRQVAKWQQQRKK